MGIPLNTWGNLAALPKEVLQTNLSLAGSFTKYEISINGAHFGQNSTGRSTFRDAAHAVRMSPRTGPPFSEFTTAKRPLPPVGSTMKYASTPGFPPAEENIND
jgi:hypothetical protein